MSVPVSIRLVGILSRRRRAERTLGRSPAATGMGVDHCRCCSRNRKRLFRHWWTSESCQCRKTREYASRPPGKTRSGVPAELVASYLRSRFAKTTLHMRTALRYAIARARTREARYRAPPTSTSTCTSTSTSTSTLCILARAHILILDIGCCGDERGRAASTLASRPGAGGDD